MWEDIAMAVLLSLGLYGQWSSVFDTRTAYPLMSSLSKGASAGGLCILQAMIGLPLTALVSGAHALGFVMLALFRRPPISSPISAPRRNT